MAAHWSRDIAPVPESVRKSINTSFAGSLNRLKSTAATAARRSSSVVSRSGSTEWIRNGSMIVLKLTRGTYRADAPNRDSPGTVL